MSERVITSTAPLRVWRDGRLVVDMPEALVVDAGEVVALRGDNGAGKSSILLGCLGLLPSTLTVRGRIGYVPQQLLPSPALPLSVGDTLRLLGVASAFHPAVIASAGLLLTPKRPLAALSTGERTRLLMATVVHARPKALLLDEPTASLDADSRQRVLAQVGLVAQAGTAVLLVSHSDDDVAVLGARTVDVHAPREHP
jgi:ABC-type Mn2+/Zn2+ transport system ATPase subunit